MIHRLVGKIIPILLVAISAIVPTAALASGGSFIGPLHSISVVASTIPANGDVNPYGLAVIPSSTGKLEQGDILVSNFNASSNLQGTGTTIVQVDPNGHVSQFAQINPATLPGPCPGGVGLTGALVVLQRGWVIVGSLPTADGTSATAQAGCLIVLDNNGNVVETFADKLINGPWGMIADDDGSIAHMFVANVLNGTVAANGNVVNKGTVVRFNLSVPWPGAGSPSIQSSTIVGSGFAERTDPAALVVGPLGLGLERDTLFVAEGVSSRIAAIPNAIDRSSSAGIGSTVTIGGLINDPLGLAIAPNGDILTTNGNNGLLVETTPTGQQIAAKLIDNTGSPKGAGCLFGLAIVPGNSGVYYADDCSNTLNLLS